MKHGQPAEGVLLSSAPGVVRFYHVPRPWSLRQNDEFKVGDIRLTSPLRGRVLHPSVGSTFVWKKVQSKLLSEFSLPVSRLNL